MQVVISQGLPKLPSPVVAPVRTPEVSSVALYGDDHTGLKLRIGVKVGDRVVPGQALFHDRLNPSIVFVSPVTGAVSEIRAGPRRTLQSLVIDVKGPPESGLDWCDPLGGFDGLAALPDSQLRQLLQQSGLWTSIRQRPGDRLAPAEGQADAVLITAIDTDPFALSPVRVLEGRWGHFWLGVAALARFARRVVWICSAPGFPMLPPELEAKAREAAFIGPHPAGLPGTHISRLSPLGIGRTAWHVGFEDVAAIGQLLQTGRLSFVRTIGLARPESAKVEPLRVPSGARVSDLVDAAGSELVCGSALAGRPAVAPFEHLGRFHRQITVLPPGKTGLQLGWPKPGCPIRLHPGQSRPLAGGMLPHEGLEKRWVLDVPPAPLLRALMTGDHEKAVALGCLDLGEEDLALASLVCPGGHDYGAYLREALDAIHREAGQ